MSNLKAFYVTEPMEGTGGIIFAKSNIHARKWGADEWNDGELRGMTCRRAPAYDKYGNADNIPASEMAEDGWNFECSGCGMEMNEYALEDAELDFGDIVGFQNDDKFCCADCRDRYHVRRAREKALSAEYLEILREHVTKRFGPVEFVTGVFRQHVYVSFNYGHYLLEDASVSFRLPELKHDLTLRLDKRHDGWPRIQGPWPLRFYCSQADHEKFVEIYGESDT